jgi:hypothetical protein
MGIWQRSNDGDGWVEIDLNRMNEPDKTEESECGPHRDCLTLQSAQHGTSHTHAAGSVPVTVLNPSHELQTLNTQKHPVPDNCHLIF